MVKLPDSSDLGYRAPQASGITPRFPSFPSSDPRASALQSLGQAAQGLGSTLMAKAEEQKAKQLQAERFNQTNRLLQFEQDWNDHIIERDQTVQPGAAGYSSSLEKDFNTQARGFMKDVPPELRPEIDQRLQRERMQVMGRAQTFERGEAKRYSVEQGVNSETTLLTRAKQDPSAWREVEAEGRQLWDNNPHIDNIERHKQRERWEERRSEAELEQMDPRAAKEALTPQAGGTADASTLIRQFEGFRAKPYWDVNADRIGYGSDTITLPNGTIKRVTKDTVVSREDADRDLQRRIGEFQGGIVRSVGEDAWSGLSENQQAALTSVAYNYGKLPQSVAAAVKAGDAEGIAQSIEGLARHNGGVNSNRRMQEAAVARGGSTAIDPRFAGLSYEKREQFITRADARIEQQKREYLTDIDDYVGFLHNGNPEAETGRYSADDLVANLGEEDAAIVHQEIQKAESFGADVKAVKWATPAEVDVVIAARQSMLDNPEDFAENAQNLNGLAAVITERNRAIAVDPARYVRENPTVQESYEALQAADEAGHVAAARNYANASMALQGRMGVPSSKQRILSNEDVANIAASFAEQSEGGQNAADHMGALEMKWGDEWPRVFGELAEHGKLPGAAMVVGSMNRLDQKLAREQLAEAALTGRKALEDALPEQTVEDIKEKMEATHGMFSSGVGSQLQEFRATLRHMPGGSAEHTFGQYKEAINLLALRYAGQGEDASSAASRAYDEVLGKAYTIVGSFRVPTEYDSDAVEAGTQRVLAELDQATIEIDRRVVSLIGLPEDEARAGFISHLQSEGRWVTSEDETGLSLLTGDQRMVTTRNGEPLVVPWEELQGSGTSGWRPFLLLPGFGPIPNFLGLD